MPLLRSDPAWLTVPTLVPETEPLPELARALAATAARQGLRWSAGDVPDGHTLATASDDQTVILWELPRFDRFRGNEVREACLRAGGPLDRATWEQYAPGVSYQDTCAGR